MVEKLAPDQPMNVRSMAAAQMRTLAATGQTRVAIAQAGGIPHLVELCWNGSEQGRERATTCLAHLAENTHNCVLIAQEGGIAAIVEMSRVGSFIAREKANEALERLK